LYQKYINTGNAAIINLGGKQIEVLVYNDRMLIERLLLPVGGENIIRDICYGMKVSSDEATAMLFNYNDLFSSYLKEERSAQLNMIIDARVKEIFNLLKKVHYNDSSTVLLTGGLVNIPKLSEYLGQYLNIPVSSIRDHLYDQNQLTVQTQLMIDYCLFSQKDKKKGLFK